MKQFFQRLLTPFNSMITLTTCDMQEKKIGLGEDSDPILLQFDKLTITGVFDGMGGAGGAECESDFGSGYTKAYVGSRIVKAALENMIRQNPSFAFHLNFKDILLNTIGERYQEELQKYPPKSKGLRSALIKEYPTTLAITCVREEGNKYVIDSFWAGDSRNYIWTPKGLFQISKDDLKGDLDPLQNLRDDAPMSNCVHADGKFFINHKCIEGLSTNDKFLIISATDGCFGYYPSPMDFETTLYECVKYSKNMDELKQKLSKAFAYVTADDFSYSIAAFGFGSYKELNKTFSHLSNSNVLSYFRQRKKYEDLIRKRDNLLKDIEQLSNELEAHVDAIWKDYKKSYLKYVNNNEEG